MNKVVCIRDDWHPAANVIIKNPVPIKGQIYKVEKTVMQGGYLAYWLEGYPQVYRSDYFRPVVHQGRIEDCTKQIRYR